MKILEQPLKTYLPPYTDTFWLTCRKLVSSKIFVKPYFCIFSGMRVKDFIFFPVRFSHLRREMLSATGGFYRGSGCCELLYRSSRPKLFCRKDVLKNFAKFGRKDLCQSLCFNKAAGHRPATLLKRRLWYRCFPVNFVKFLQISFLREHLRWLLLFSDRFQCQNP